MLGLNGLNYQFSPVNPLQSSELIDNPQDTEFFVSDAISHLPQTDRT